MREAHMKNGRRFIAIVCILIILLSGCGTNFARDPTIKNETSKITLYENSKSRVINLDGEWAFYWNERIPPGSFDEASDPLYLRVPSYWNKYKEINAPSYGYGTYRFVAETNCEPGVYSLQMPEIYTEYSLWVNGSLIEANGSFAGEPPTYVNPEIFDFYCDTSEIEIVLQVKNDTHVNGGIGQSIRLGSATALHRERNAAIAIDMFLLSVCMFAGLFFLILFLFIRKTEVLWFFILCVSVSFRNLLSNTSIMMEIFPNLPFWLGSKLVTSSVPIIVIAVLLYAKRIFENETKRTAFKVLMIMNVTYLALVIITPIGIYTSLFTPYLITVGVNCALGLYVSLIATIRKKPDAILFFIGVLLLSAGALLDALVYMQILNISYMLTASLFVFVILQVVLLSKRYADTYKRMEILSVELSESMNKLKNTETAFMGAQMKPHFLYNALTAIAEKCDSDAKEAGALILSLAKYLRHTLDFDSINNLVSVRKELELVRAYTSIECARFDNIEVVYDLPDPLPELDIPPLSLQPLVENAIKHGLRKRACGGRVVITAELRDNFVEFSVADNGIGMPENHQRFLTEQPKGHLSIGLYNINARLQRIFGKGLIIESQKDSGTVVRFTIPRQKGGAL